MEIELAKVVTDPIDEKLVIDNEKMLKNEEDAKSVSSALKSILEETKLLEGCILKLYAKNSEFEVIKQA